MKTAMKNIVALNAYKERLKQSLISSRLISLYNTPFLRSSLFCGARMLHFKRMEPVVSFLGH